MIEVKGLYHRYSSGGVFVLQNVSFRVNNGQIVALLGVNGSGKTTSMNIITGFLRPTGGVALVDRINSSINPWKVRERIGYLPEEVYLYGSLSGREFLEFVASIRHCDIENAYHLCKALNMFDSLDQQIATYSGGMKRKLQLVSAIMHAPPNVILDEPTNAMDPRSTRVVRDLIIGMKKRGVAILFSTHILEVAEKLADYIYIIHRGRIVAEGTMSELKKLAQENANLEDIFISLTGGVDEQEVAAFLSAFEGVSK